MAEWDTLAIQERILRDARVPRGSLYSSLDALLPLLDQHLRTVIVPRLLDVGEDYLAATLTYPIVPGKGTYRLPARSLRLLEVSLLDSAGRPRAFFSRATSTQVTKFRSYNRVRPTGPVEYWWFEASAIQLYPAPASDDGTTVVLRYARRPSRLVDPSTVWTIAAVNPLSITVETATPPIVDGKYDIVKGNPGFESAVDNFTATAVEEDTTDVWTVSGVPEAVVATLEVGDYLCPAGTSPVPQVPLDYLKALEHSVVAQLQRANGDLDAAAASDAALQAILLSAASDFAPRADEQTSIVQNDW